MHSPPQDSGDPARWSPCDRSIGLHDAGPPTGWAPPWSSGCSTPLRARYRARAGFLWVGVCRNMSWESFAGWFTRGGLAFSVSTGFTSKVC